MAQQTESSFCTRLGKYARLSACIEVKMQHAYQMIDIRKDKPKIGQRVLIYRPFSHEKPHCDPNFKIATYCGEGLWIGSHFQHEITHWLPLIKPL